MGNDANYLSAEEVCAQQRREQEIDNELRAKARDGDESAELELISRVCGIAANELLSDQAEADNNY